MYLHETVQLAAIAATHSQALICGPGEIPESSLECYWTASKCRLDRWGHSLRGLSDTPSSTVRGEQGQLLLAELFTTEVLTRVWTAVLTGYDRRRGAHSAEPIARSVYIGHLEARNRGISLLLSGRIPLETATKLDALRRRCERWTDLLIAHTLGTIDLSEFTHEPARARDFAEDLQHDAGLSYGSTGWQLQMASLRAAFRSVGGAGVNADLNDRVAASVTCCFPPELFNGCGILQSVWYSRMAHHCDDAQGMIDDLFREERHPRQLGFTITSRASTTPPPGYLPKRNRGPSTKPDSSQE